MVHKNELQNTITELTLKTVGLCCNDSIAFRRCHTRRGMKMSREAIIVNS